MIPVAIGLVTACCVALALGGPSAALARRLGAVDVPGRNHRQVHAAPVPRLGGLPMAAGTLLPLLVARAFGAPVDDGLLAALVAGGLALAALGVVDDLVGVRPLPKLLVTAAVAAFVAPLGPAVVDLPLVGPLDLGALAAPVAVLWVAGVTHALNLVDGLDGLATGVALVGLAVIGLAAGGDPGLLLPVGALAGALLGFLPRNLHPARLFLGDGGALFVGWALAVVALAGVGRGTFGPTTAVLALGLPVLEASTTLFRRARLGQSLLDGDRLHLHHRLLDGGLPQPRVVRLLVTHAAGAGALGLLAHAGRPALAAGLALGLGAVLLRRAHRHVSDGADAVRERNRLVALAVAHLDERLARSAGVESAAAGLAELCFAAGAATARLELRLPGEPVRTWSWAPGPVAVGAHVAFAVPGPLGRDLGTLHVTWPGAEPPAATLPGLEAGVRRLARHLLPSRAAATAS